MKKIIIIFVSCVLSLYGCSRDRNKWEINPGQSVGPIIESSSEQDLIRFFGKENVKRKKIYIGEGNFLNGHVLFEGTKNECEILWVNDLKPPIDRVIFSQSRGAWHMKNGLSVGISLSKLNQINERPFVFYGFEWDMGGLVTSWENGKISTDAKDALVVYLDPAHIKNKIPNDLLGDGEIRSDNSILSDLDIRVGKIEVLLQNSTPKRGTIIAESGLVLRDSPSADGLRQASIPFDAEVEIVDANGPSATIDNITANWIKIRYNQYEGWVFGGYVDLIE